MNCRLAITLLWFTLERMNILSIHSVLLNFFFISNYFSWNKRKTNVKLKTLILLYCFVCLDSSFRFWIHDFFSDCLLNSFSFCWYSFDCEINNFFSIFFKKKVIIIIIFLFCFVFSNYKTATKNVLNVFFILCCCCYSLWCHFQSRIIIQ